MPRDAFERSTWMRALVRLCACAALAACAVASARPASTWYVRADGGDAEQCSGLADVAYPGKGKHLACAWAGPMIALPPPAGYGQAATPRIGGGDTLIIGAGSYMVGLGAPGAEACTSGIAYACTMAPLPSGPSPQQPTRVLGAGFDSGCAKPPQLWGTQRAYAVLDLTRSSHVELACLEITDHSACVENHCGGEGGCRGEVDRCERDRYPYGNWAENGLVASDSHDVHVRDVNIHGMGNDGVRAGRLTDWTVERFRIHGNGFAGWDGDIANGDRSVDTGNHGAIVFRQGEIGFNGCGERWPGGEPYGCWGQEEGGYGDGLGTGRTGGEWLFEDVHAHHNTQDGLDLLYLDEHGSVTMRRVRAEGNAGNQLKVAGHSLIEHATVDGDCAYFSDPAHRGAGNMRDSDACRAAGDAIAAALRDGQTTTVKDSTISGQGGCLVTGSGGGDSAVLELRDNTLDGRPRWDDKTRQTCGYFLYQSKARIVAEGNTLTNVRQATASVRAVCDNGAEDSVRGHACRALERLYDSIRGDGGDKDAKRP